MRLVNMAPTTTTKASLISIVCFISASLANADVIFVGLGDPTPKTSELYDDVANCPAVGELNHEIQSAAGGFINEAGAERVLVCNGFDNLIFAYSSLCYEYSFATASWSRSAFQTKVARLRPASVMLDDTRLFITGGTTDGAGATNTTEVFSDVTKSFQFGPTLPSGVFDHCVVQATPDLTILIGGQNEVGVPEARVLTLDWTRATPQWELAPDIMSSPREGLACAASLDGQTVVVAGGNFAGAPLDAVDLYDVATGTFSRGPSMPFAITDGTLLAMDNGKFAYVGGWSSQTSYSNKVFELDLISGQWSEKARTLSDGGKTRFVGASIPTSIAGCA